MLRRRSECLDDADESGTEYFLSANTSMSSLYSSSSESDFINFHVLNSSHFDQITMAVEELIDKRNDKTTTEEETDWADGFNEEEIDLIQNVARLVQDAREFWETVDDHDDEMYTLREREEALSQSYLELELVAAVTDVHVDWLVQQTLRLNEKYENQEDDQTEEEHKKDDETKTKAKEKEHEECRRESIVCVHTTTKKMMMMKHEYSIEQQIDDIPSHFSFQTGLGSENGSDYGRDRSPSVGPPINFSQAVLYDMPSAHQQLKNIANAYVLNKTQFGELEYDDDANDLSVWLDVICMEFEGFNRQFVRQVMSLHRRDVEKTVYALHELEMTRRVRNVRLHGGGGDRTGGGKGGDGCSVHWVPPRARRESTVYTSVGSTISRLSQM